MAQPNLPAVTAIVVAAGASRRMGFDKLSYRLPDGRTVLETSCAALAAHPAITQLVLVCGGNRAACEAIAARHMGMQIAGVSFLSNMAAGVTGAPLTQEEVEAAGAEAAPRFAALITAFLQLLEAR